MSRLSAQEREFSVPILSHSAFPRSCIKFVFRRARIPKMPGTREREAWNARPSLLDTIMICQVLGFKEEEEEEAGEGRVTGTEFTDVDLTELEWADYDEKSGLSTVISGSGTAYSRKN